MTESVEHCSAAVIDEDMNARIFKTPTQLVLPRIYYNSRGDKEYIPGCSLENKPILGMKFDSLGDGKSIREIPYLYIMNRWRKDILKKASTINVFLDDASKYDKKKQLVSDVWSKIFSCVSLFEQSEDDLSELIRTLLSSFEEQMLTKNNPATSSKEVKDADIQVLVGSNEVDVNILPPNQCLNK
uniref:Uncharacterized protein n=1 Tax=Chenopodium quinoa TaxID=63459 RepID=A0A803LVK6_CHEQI